MVCSSSLILVVDACQFSALGDNSTTRYALYILSREHTYTCARTCKRTIQLGVNAPFEHYDYFSNYCFSSDHIIRLDRVLYWRLLFQTLSVTTAPSDPCVHLPYCNELSAYTQVIACTTYMCMYVWCAYVTFI